MASLVSSERRRRPVLSRIRSKCERTVRTLIAKASAMSWSRSPDASRLAEGDALSQHEAAKRLGIDRTTMVAMLDTLAGKELIARRQHPDDRRRNIVELSAAGRRTLRKGTRLSADVEDRFLAPLGARDSQRFRDALHALISDRK
jgi:DNA-binding MarR family transcriptional regulator